MVNGACKGIMIAATKQHTGKTSVCMAVLSSLMRRLGAENVGYMKPMGQRYTFSKEGVMMDCDVETVRSYFSLDRFACQDMSPIVVHEKMTRNFLRTDSDGSTTHRMLENIQSSHQRICEKSKFVVVEGSGHVGVGSLLGISNARIANQLGLDMVLVTNAGIGKMFDELSLNLQLCAANHVRVRGVIINRMRENQQGNIRRHMGDALQRSNIPVIAMVPDKEFLDSPSVMDLERLFKAELLSGQKQGRRKFCRYELVTTSLRRLLEKIHNDNHDETCFLAHRTRDDVVLGLLSHAASHPFEFHGGLIMTGARAPNNDLNKNVLDYILKSEMPVMDVENTTSQAIRMINGYTAKMCASDTDRIRSVIDHYQRHINMDMIV